MNWRIPNFLDIVKYRILFFFFQTQKLKVSGNAQYATGITKKSVTLKQFITLWLMVNVRVIFELLILIDQIVSSFCMYCRKITNHRFLWSCNAPSPPPAPPLLVCSWIILSFWFIPQLVSIYNITSRTIFRQQRLIYDSCLWTCLFLLKRKRPPSSVVLMCQCTLYHKRVSWLSSLNSRAQ